MFSTGILVTGGLGSSDEVLDSVEFYDLDKSSWTRVSSLKVARAEHTMSLIYGLPTVEGEVVCLFLYILRTKGRIKFSIPYKETNIIEILITKRCTGT